MAKVKLRLLEPNAIRGARQRMGLTQAEVGAQTGQTPRTIRSLETRKYWQDIRAVRLARNVCDVLQTRAIELGMDPEEFELGNLLPEAVEAQAVGSVPRHLRTPGAGEEERQKAEGRRQSDATEQEN